MSARRDRIAAQFEQNHAKRLSIGFDGIVRGAAPYRLDGSATRAVLLVHGFNDTPQSVAPLARALQSAGWTVVAPLLPGHGRSLPAMVAESRAEAWLASVRAEYAALRESHGTVALCGLSMGAALCVLLAAEHPEVPALVLMAPYLGMSWGWQAKLLLAWGAMLFTPYLKGSGGERSIHDPEARARALGPGVNTARTLSGLRTIALAAEAALPAVRMPTLYLQSREDNRVTSADAERHFAMLGAAVREQRWLTGCGHIITADYCRDEVARQVTAWLAQHARGGNGNA